MQNIKLSIDKAFGFVSEQHVAGYKSQVAAANAALHNGTGKGSDFLGWLNLPSSIDEAHLTDIENTAKILRDNCEVVVVIGIGGSYLGAKAVIDALSNSFDWLQTKRTSPAIVYAGQNIGEDYLYELQELLKDKKFGLISISKSGTTTEPALAFRLLKTQLEDQQGKAAAQKLIVAITDKSRGALRTLATQEGYKTFVIDDNIGGRYSVLSPVGLLPIAVAGFDIRQLVAGALKMETVCGLETPFEENPAAQYAAVRNELYKNGKGIEILVNFHPKLHFIGEWWKQLYGESEGKDGKGIFPASVDMTTDLHSLGQYIQDGQRILFETMISVKSPFRKITIPLEKDDSDQLNYLAGKRLSEVNHNAKTGTILAHNDGNVPIIIINIPTLDEYYIGQMIYFFEMACAISGYILDVNPFDQPGVEAYKSNMFALLNKPGFEEASKKIKERLK